MIISQEKEGKKMKIWTKVHLKDRNRNVELISKSLTNYLYGDGPILELQKKYQISKEDKKILDQYTANRIGGLLMLYLAKDTGRINDIVNKYHNPYQTVEYIIPEIEGYINKSH